MVMSYACFGPRHSPYSNYKYRASDIAAIGTTSNVFSNHAVLNRDSNISPPRQWADTLCIELRSWVYLKWRYCSFYLNALMIPHGWAFAWSIVNELLPVAFEATERSSTDVLLNHHTNCRCIVESRKLILFHLLAAYKQFTAADLWSLDWRRVPVSLPVSCQPSFQQHPFKFQKQHRRESRWWLFGWSAGAEAEKGLKQAGTIMLIIHAYTHIYSHTSTIRGTLSCIHYTHTHIHTHTHTHMHTPPLSPVTFHHLYTVSTEW